MESAAEAPEHAVRVKAATPVSAARRRSRFMVRMGCAGDRCVRGEAGDAFDLWASGHRM